LLLGLLELQLELGRVNPLGLGNEDATLEQLELLRRSVRLAKIVALASDGRELVGCRAELVGRRDQPLRERSID
jgi:hypothetical protein